MVEKNTAAKAAVMNKTRKDIIQSPEYHLIQSGRDKQAIPS